MLPQPNESQEDAAIGGAEGDVTISAFLVAYNEGDHIRGCMESLRGCVDEIVVVHDGECGDHTLDVAREYTDKVYVHPRVGNNDPLTPYALEQTTSDWVLKIDADERLSSELRADIRSLIERDDVDAYSLLFPFMDPETGKPDTRYQKYKRVLFRRELMYKVGIPHARNCTRGREETADLVLEHHVASPDNAWRLLRSYEEKNKGRSRIAASALCGDLDDIPVFNCSMTEDRDLRLVKKLLFQRRLPWLALFVLPAYGFLDLYFRQGRYKGGTVGLVDALNVPLFHFWTCVKILKYRLTGAC